MKVLRETESRKLLKSFAVFSATKEKEASEQPFAPFYFYLFNSFLYHPNRHYQIFSIESAETVCHAKDGTCAEPQRGFIDNAECFDDAFIRYCRFFDFKGA